MRANNCVAAFTIIGWDLCRADWVGRGGDKRGAGGVGGAGAPTYRDPEQPFVRFLDGFYCMVKPCKFVAGTTRSNHER